MALAASGAFGQAFAELPVVAGEDSAEVGEIRSALFEILVRRADDHDFLHYALAEGAAAPRGLSQETANDLAQRLVALGFVAAAEPFVAPRAQGAAARVRRLLRAEIAMRKRRPRQAELEVLGITGSDADRLRARARSLAGEHGAARVLYESVGLQPQAQREAWLASDWAALRETEVPAVAAMATRKLAPVESMDEDEDAVLARNRRMAEDSEGVRGAVRALLAAHPPPDVPKAPQNQSQQR